MKLGCLDCWLIDSVVIYDKLRRSGTGELLHQTLTCLIHYWVRKMGRTKALAFNQSAQQKSHGCHTFDLIWMTHAYSVCLTFFRCLCFCPYLVISPYVFIVMRLFMFFGIYPYIFTSTYIRTSPFGQDTNLLLRCILVHWTLQQRFNEMNG